VRRTQRRKRKNKRKQHPQELSGTTVTPMMPYAAQEASKRRMNRLSPEPISPPSKKKVFDDSVSESSEPSVVDKGDYMRIDELTSSASEHENEVQEKDESSEDEARPASSQTLEEKCVEMKEATDSDLEEGELAFEEAEEDLPPTPVLTPREQNNSFEVEEVEEKTHTPSTDELVEENLVASVEATPPPLVAVSPPKPPPSKLPKVYSQSYWPYWKGPPSQYYPSHTSLIQAGEYGTFLPGARPPPPSDNFLQPPPPPPPMTKLQSARESCARTVARWTVHNAPPSVRQTSTSTVSTVPPPPPLEREDPTLSDAPPPPPLVREHVAPSNVKSSGNRSPSATTLSEAPLPPALVRESASLPKAPPPLPLVRASAKKESGSGSSFVPDAPKPLPLHRTSANRGTNIFLLSIF
tara:strand:+ start:1919 stop:3148 length:1230 start_codon:yes stop_codon:yes gene_type:complete